MTQDRSYWLTTYTLKTWEEAQISGGNVAGFRSFPKTVFESISVGDYFLCYVMKLKRFIAVQEVISEAYLDDRRIWDAEVFPFRVDVKTFLKLTPETAVPIYDLAKRLSIFEKGHWSVYLRNSPRKWTSEDGQQVVRAVELAVSDPVSRQIDYENLR